MSSVLDALKKMEEETVTLPSPLPGQGRRRLPLLAVVFVAGVGVALAGITLATYFKGGALPKAGMVSQTESSPAVFRVVAAPLSTKKPVIPPVSASAPLSPASSPAAGEPTLLTAVTKKAPPRESAVEVVIASPVAPAAPSTPALPFADTSVFHMDGGRWSQTPSRRIAVINGQIVREGAGVDGAVVQAITPEGVVLEVKGARQFLAFGRR